MTDGHKHRHLRVKSWDSWWVRALRKPVLVVHDPDLFERVESAPYPYGPIKEYHGGKVRTCWALTPLGILHRWTGLTLERPEP